MEYKINIKLTHAEIRKLEYLTDGDFPIIENGEFDEMFISDEVEDAIKIALEIL